jgi:membrane AbrB-like protein
MRQHVKHFFIVIGIAIIGAFVGKTLNLPMGILVGSFLFIAIAKIGGLNVAPLKKKHKQKIQMVIGGLVGLSLQPDVASLFFSLLIPGFLATAAHLLFAFLMAFIFTKVFHLNWLTAISGCIPAGMSEISNVAEEINADEQVVMLMHLFRVSMLILILPIVIKFLLS